MTNSFAFKKKKRKQQHFFNKTKLISCCFNLKKIARLNVYTFEKTVGLTFWRVDQNQPIQIKISHRLVHFRIIIYDGCCCVCMTCLVVVVGRDYVIIYAQRTSTTVRVAYNKSLKIPPPLFLSFSPFLPSLVCETYTHVRIYVYIYTYRMFFIRLERVVFKTKKLIGSTTIQQYIKTKKI